MIIEGPHIYEFADELQFLDTDIVEAFKGKNYLIGTPTNVQLIREIRKLVLAIEEKSK